MKIAMTGATGFLGGHLCEAAQRAGHEVVALVRASSKVDELAAKNIEHRVVKLETGAGVAEAIDDVEGIIHAAAVVKAKDAGTFHRVNVDGTAHLIEAAAQRPLKRFVLISSLAAHGFRQDGKPRGLDEPSCPVTLYGRSKRASEEVALRYAEQVPLTILRPPAIYGPGDKEMYAFFQSISRRVVPFLGSPDNQLSLVYGPDCAEAAVAMLTHDAPSGQVYYVEDGAPHTQREFANTVADALGVKPLPIPVSVPVLTGAAWVSETFGKMTGKAVMLTRDKVNELKQPYLICDAAETRAQLGWQPRHPLADGVRETVSWYRENRWL